MLAYKKARRGTRKSEEASQFFFRTEQELFKLQELLRTETYRPGAYRYFEINDPKHRIIAVAPFCDRVVHHAVVAVLEPIFEATFIHDSYATRKNKGVHKAVFQAQKYLRKNQWYLKADINKFFDSVDIHILMTIISRKVKDNRLMRLIQRILENGSKNGIGLPIGNLTSQFFANVYLNQFDYFVKQHLRVPDYVRYMDDFVLFMPEKQDLKSVLPRLSCFLEDNLKLKLKPESIRLHPAMHGLPFLGLRIFGQMLRFLPENSRRIRIKLSNKMADFEAGTISEKVFLDSMNSYNAHLTVFHTRALRTQLFGI